MCVFPSIDMKLYTQADAKHTISFKRPMHSNLVPRLIDRMKMEFHLKFVAMALQFS